MANLGAPQGLGNELDLPEAKLHKLLELCPTLEGCDSEVKQRMAATLMPDELESFVREFDSLMVTNAEVVKKDGRSPYTVSGIAALVLRAGMYNTHSRIGTEWMDQGSTRRDKIHDGLIATWDPDGGGLEGS